MAFFSINISLLCNFHNFITNIIHPQFYSLYKYKNPKLKTMKKFIISINPKHIFNIKKKPNSSFFISKSEPVSFTSSYSSGSSSDSSVSTHPVRTRSEDIFLRSDFTAEDGKISKVELESILKRVIINAPSLSEEDIDNMINEISIDGDGCISLEELGAVGFDPTGANEEELKGAFGFFDADADGKISARELHAGFLALGDEKCTLEECERMIKSVDNNRDGFVCFEDFSRMMSFNNPR